MSQLVRFGVSIDEKLLSQFDTLIKHRNYQNRSEAIRDLIRTELVEQQWQHDELIAGGIALVYDHHHGSMVTQLLTIQHDFHEVIISSQHVHLDHDNCLEIVVVRGISQRIFDLYHQLKTMRGIKHINILKSTTGQSL